MKATTLAPATPEQMKAIETELENHLTAEFKEKECVTLVKSIYEIDKMILKECFFEAHIVETLVHLGYAASAKGYITFYITDLQTN